MSLITKIRQLFKAKAEFKSGYRSELDAFYHEYNEKRKDWLENPRRVKEITRHQEIFEKRDYSVEKKTEILWKNF